MGIPVGNYSWGMVGECWAFVKYLSTQVNQSHPAQSLWLVSILIGSCYIELSSNSTTLPVPHLLMKAQFQYRKLYRIQTRMLDRLEARGFVARSRNKGDRRVVNVGLI